MRLIRFDEGRSGLLREQGTTTEVVDFTDELPDGSSWLPLIRDWSSWKPRLERLLSEAPSVAAFEDVAVHAPVPDPSSRIFALGTNFADHVDNATATLQSAESLETQKRRGLGGFFVIPGTVHGHAQDIAPPPEAAKIDYEAEVAIVLANDGYRVGPEGFSIWGHMGYNDLSIRDPYLGIGLKDIDSGTLSWGLQKNFQGGNVAGPWLTVDEGYDYANLAMRSRVNGAERQNGTTASMLYSFTEGASQLARFLELKAGDVFTSGTPGGTAIEQGIDGPYLESGDVVEVEIEGAGILRNRIVRFEA